MQIKGGQRPEVVHHGTLSDGTQNKPRGDPNRSIHKWDTNIAVSRLPVV